jgi:hypothetical protein
VEQLATVSVDSASHTLDVFFPGLCLCPAGSAPTRCGARKKTHRTRAGARELCTVGVQESNRVASFVDGMGSIATSPRQALHAMPAVSQQHVRSSSVRVLILAHGVGDTPCAGVRCRILHARGLVWLLS